MKQKLEKGLLLQAKHFLESSYLFTVVVIFLLVSGQNWIIIIPLMACLLLSLLGNVILVCRLRFRQQEYDLPGKDHKVVEAVPVKRLDPPKTESMVEKTLLLFRRSADVTEV